jgi:hypothetical protein
MEKTLQFSVVKEKIIKTNELLRVLMEKNKMLEKTQQWTQQLKTKLELSKNEANKLKLKNETVVHELMSTENKYALLNKELEVCDWPQVAGCEEVNTPSSASPSPTPSRTPNGDRSLD